MMRMRLKWKKNHSNVITRRNHLILLCVTSVEQGYNGNYVYIVQGLGRVGVEDCMVSE